MLALLAAPAAASVHDRPANGRILWSRFNDDTFTTARVVSANSDGSGLRVLSRGAEGEQDLDPMPSPRGGRVTLRAQHRRRQRRRDRAHERGRQSAAHHRHRLP